MKHIETPVRVSYYVTPHGDDLRNPIILDSANQRVSQGARLADNHPPYDAQLEEAARAINAHDALVEALEKARYRIWHTASCPWGIAGRMCSCGASGIKQGIEDALALAKGETE